MYDICPVHPYSERPVTRRLTGFIESSVARAWHTVWQALGMLNPEAMARGVLAIHFWGPFDKSQYVGHFQ